MLEPEIARIIIYVGTFGLAVGGVAKPLVDIFKMVAPNAPGWSFPLLAILLSFLIALLLPVAAGGYITQQSSALALLAGLSGGAGAVGITALHKAGEAKREQALEATNKTAEATNGPM